MGVTSIERPAALRARRVLVVEDEALIAMAVEDELAEAGAHVVGPVSSVGEALRLLGAALAEGGLDAAVLDMDLEGEDVAPVADALAAAGVPFLFHTGYDEGRDRGRHGAAPVLAKPLGLLWLVAAVKGLVTAAR